MERARLSWILILALAASGCASTKRAPERPPGEDSATETAHPEAPARRAPAELAWAERAAPIEPAECELATEPPEEAPEEPTPALDRVENGESALASCEEVRPRPGSEPGDMGHAETAPGEDVAPVASSAASRSPNYEVAGVRDPEAFRTLFHELQASVAADQREAVAKALPYPLRVNRRGTSPDEKEAVSWIDSEAALLESYESVFTPAVRKALANQREPDLFASWQGVMVGSGELWFTPVGEGERYLVTFNLGVPADR